METTTVSLQPTPNMTGDCGNDELRYLFNWVIICAGLPAICLAGCALFKLIRNDHVAPIYVLNLILSDFLQIFVRPVFMLSDHLVPVHKNVCSFAIVMMNISFASGAFFMTCISLERYLSVVHPLWYRYCRNVRNSVFLVLAVWLFAISFTVTVTFTLDNYVPQIFATIFFLPLPFLVFCYVRTRKVMDRSRALHHAEKRRILCTLLLVLGIYCMLFVPYSFVQIAKTLLNQPVPLYLDSIVFNMVDLSALFDPVLYIFMRKDFRCLDTFFCWKRKSRAVVKWKRATGVQGRSNTSEASLPSLSSCA